MGVSILAYHLIVRLRFISIRDACQGLRKRGMPIVHIQNT
jgi:hypothetical protein